MRKIARFAVMVFKHCPCVKGTKLSIKFFPEPCAYKTIFPLNDFMMLVLNRSIHSECITLKKHLQPKTVSYLQFIYLQPSRILFLPLIFIALCLHVMQPLGSFCSFK